MIIAIDGPAGSGKSTIAKLISKELNFSYLDTGAMYRIVALYFLQNNIDFSKNPPLEFLQNNIEIDIDKDLFYLNKKDVSRDIREQKVAQNVSAVASLENVRKYLVQMQRKISQSKDIILDGRDIGTVVFPDAKIKIFLTASPDIRAKRRVEQNKELGIEGSYEEILENIIRRDLEDSTRKISPLKKAEDAVEIDSTTNSIEEVKNKILELYNKG